MHGNRTEGENPHFSDQCHYLKCGGGIEQCSISQPCVEKNTFIPSIDASSVADITPSAQPCNFIVERKTLEGVATNSRGQDYKEKHKLDSKQISNSPC